MPGAPLWTAVGAVLGWLGCCWAVRRSGWGAAATAVALPLIAVAVLWPEPALVTPGALEVTAIDVGQGLPFVIELVEPTGSETQVQGALGGQPLTGVFRERVAMKPGQTLRVRPEARAVHLFDATSTRRFA